MTDEPREIGAGHCYSCATFIVFDVAAAPSVVIDLATGQPVPAERRLVADEPRPDSWVDQPLCDLCADRAEAVARTLGLPVLWPVRQVQKVGQ